MENKQNKDENAPERPHGTANTNPVNREFYDADDPDFESDSTTGSGFSEVERDQHDGHGPGNPANPQQQND